MSEHYPNRIDDIELARELAYALDDLEFLRRQIRTTCDVLRENPDQVYDTYIVQRGEGYTDFTNTAGLNWVSERQSDFNDYLLSQVLLQHFTLVDVPDAPNRDELLQIPEESIVLSAKNRDVATYFEYLSEAFGSDIHRTTREIEARAAQSATS